MRIDGHRIRVSAPKLGLILGLAALAGGCTSFRDHRGYIMDAALVDAIQPGVDNRTSVERTLGRPTLVSDFGDKDWYYVSQQVKTPPFLKPRTESQSILRVKFDAAGNVAMVDRKAMEHVVRIDPNGDRTPTLGRERSLLDDLFGNIGSVGAPGAQTPTGPGPNGS
jgi:outer membrane protein assembly factor BamE (lipoprotein component of BamABCDE complex)